MRFAYADPPYPGQAKRIYGRHSDYAGEVDHAQLVARLVDDYPDGWALSTGASMLQGVIALCPPKVRVMAWVKPMSAYFKVYLAMRDQRDRYRELVREAHACVAEALNCPAHSWHGSDLARRWLVASATRTERRL
jgi:hypothetical protein